MITINTNDQIFCFVLFSIFKTLISYFSSAKNISLFLVNMQTHKNLKIPTIFTLI